MIRTLGACVLTALAGPALAQEEVDFSGLWRAGPNTQCVYTGGDGSALKIEDGVLYGVENRCEMSDPVSVRDMNATLFDMSCQGDDGEDGFVERAMLMQAADGGLYLIWNGLAFKYDSCGEDPAVGTVTTAEQIGIVE